MTIYYSKAVIDLVDDAVSHYAKFDNLAECYQVYYHHISYFVLEEISAQLMSDNAELAIEATCQDNPAFEKQMLPALTKYLFNSNNSDLKFEFLNEWQAGIVNYFEEIIRKLLSDRVDVYNINHGYTNNHDYGSKRDNGKEANPWL